MPDPPTPADPDAIADRWLHGPRRSLPGLPPTPPPLVLEALRRYREHRGQPEAAAYAHDLAEMVERWLP